MLCLALFACEYMHNRTGVLRFITIARRETCQRICGRRVRLRATGKGEVGRLRAWALFFDPEVVLRHAPLKPILREDAEIVKFLGYAH